MDQAFQLPLFLDLFAVFLMAATGAIEAIRREFDLVGLLGLSLATGVGGALIRDGIFLQAGVPAVVRNQDYLLAVAGAAAACLIFGRRAVLSEKLVAVVDAAALGAYAVVGMEKSLAFGLDFAPAVLVGTVNACGGGILRDVLTREAPLVFRPGQFYAFAALIGCLAYPLLRQSDALPPLAAALGAIGVTFLLRMLAITRNWRTAPVRDTGLFGSTRQPPVA
ncbi:MAG: TRIC cation channel family protein [Solidesulfovibrio sp.]|uniref:trimeric intracellular cation channel family protein n=1 Tax=Solidesulfovibrio sp. TaxID=2910990 RepID=UPI003159674B